MIVTGPLGWERFSTEHLKKLAEKGNPLELTLVLAELRKRGKNPS